MVIAMEKRKAPRFRLKKWIPIYIIKKNNFVCIGRMHDISEIGISFYCDDGSLLPNEITSVMFDLGDFQYILHANTMYVLHDRFTSRFALCFSTVPPSDLIFHAAGYPIKKQKSKQTS